MRGFEHFLCWPPTLYHHRYVLPILFLNFVQKVFFCRIRRRIIATLRLLRDGTASSQWVPKFGIIVVLIERYDRRAGVPVLVLDSRAHIQPFRFFHSIRA